MDDLYEVDNHPDGLTQEQANMVRQLCNWDQYGEIRDTQLDFGMGPGGIVILLCAYTVEHRYL